MDEDWAAKRSKVRMSEKTDENVNVNLLTILLLKMTGLTSSLSSETMAHSSILFLLPLFIILKLFNYTFRGGLINSFFIACIIRPSD